MNAFSLPELGHPSFPAFGLQNPWFSGIQTWNQIYYWLFWFSSLEMVVSGTSPSNKPMSQCLQKFSDIYETLW